MNTAQEGCGPNPRTYSKAEYDELSVKFATLEAENAKLRAELERRAVPDAWKLAVYNVAGYAHLYNSGSGIIHEIRAEHARLLAAAPSAPKADDPVKVQLLEALEKIMAAPRRWYGLIVVSEKDEVQACTAIAAARQEGGKV